MFLFRYCRTWWKILPGKPQSNSLPPLVATVPPLKMASDDSEDKNNRLVWVDLEMTGLDVEKDHILEASCIITDGKLNVIEEGPNIVIHQSNEVLRSMNEWCVEQHGKSGLTEAVRRSTVTLTEAEDQLLTFVQKHTPKGKCPLAGNSIHCDKKFLDKYMRRLMDHLHYRIVDVSTVKELCKRWYPSELWKANSSKARGHRALQDIRESIEELKYYQHHIFKKNTKNKNQK